MRWLSLLCLFCLISSAALGITLESLTMLNKYSLANYFSNYLGYYYDSHGCLHFSPADIYLLCQVLPKGTTLTIHSYREKAPLSLQQLPLLNTVVNQPADLRQLRSYFVSYEGIVHVYPADNLLYLSFNGVPYGKMKALAGLPDYFLAVLDLKKDQPISWDPVLSTPTDPGSYKIFKTTTHYLSATYRNTTIVPFGAPLRKVNGSWSYQLGKKSYPLPKNLVADLNLHPWEETNYNYYEVTTNQYGFISTARWGGHDFGKDVLMWTANESSFYPEIGYAAGELLFEQVLLVQDLADLLTQPGNDELNELVKKNENFKLYQASADFVSSSGETNSALLDPTACSYYRLFNRLKMKPADQPLIDQRLSQAFKAVSEKKWPRGRRQREQTLGLYHYLRLNSLLFTKQAGWYQILVKDWSYWQELRQKMRADLNRLGITTPAARKKLVAGWLSDRLEFRLAAPPKQR